MTAEPIRLVTDFLEELTGGLTIPPGGQLPIDPRKMPAGGYLEVLRYLEIPEWPHVIPEVLPEGHVILYGLPGSGKSRLAVQWAHCVAYQRPWAGYVPEQPGRVLCVDFENLAEGLTRASQQIDPFGDVDTDRIGIEAAAQKRLVHVADPFKGDNFDVRLLELDELLAAKQAEGELPRLVIIDTLQRFCFPYPDTNSQRWEVRCSGLIDALALRYHVCILSVHHANKAGALSGSTGLAGGATAVFKIRREGGSSEGSLMCDGKHRGGRDSLILRGVFTGRWDMVDEVTRGQVETGHTRRRILDWLYANGPAPVADIRAGLPDVKPKTVSDCLSRLARDMHVTHSSDGRWACAGRSDHAAAVRECEVCHRPMTVVQAEQTRHPNCEPGPVEAGPRFRWGPGTIGAEVNGETDDEPAPVVQLPVSHTPVPYTPAAAGMGQADGTVPGPADPAAAEPGWSGVRALVKAIDRSRMHPRRWIPPAGHARDTGDGQHRDAPQWQAAIAADRAMSSGYGWARPGLLDDYGPARLVVTFDRTQAYVSSIENVAIAPNVLRHHGPFDCDPRELGDPDPRRDGKPVGLAGIARIIVPAWDQPGIPHPLGRRARPGDELTIPTNLLEGLWKLHRDGLTARPVVADSWLGRRNTSLFSDFAKEVRAERAKHVHGSAGDTAVKRASSAAISMMRSTEVTPVYRPDWHAAVLGESMFRWWIRAWGALRAGELLAGIGAVDEVSYLVPEGADPGTWVPAGYVIGSQWGQVKRKPVMLPAAADLTGIDPARVTPAEGHKHRVYVTGPVPVAAWVSGRA